MITEAYSRLFCFILLQFSIITSPTNSELTRLQSHLQTNNPVNEFKSETFVRTASAYTYMLERVEYQIVSLTPIDDNR